MPVFYQSYFANPDGLLWVYDRKHQSFMELHPLVICYEKDLYTVKPDGKPRDTRVETKVMGLVDGVGSRGIREFHANKPNRQAEEAVAFFTAFQYMRVPTMRRDISETYARSIEEFSRIAFATVERARHVIEQHARHTGELIIVTPESMVEAVQQKQINVVATEVPFLENMLHLSAKLSRLFLDLDWEILTASKDTGFILCDCPVVTVPPRGCKDVGFLVPGSAKYFPLTRDLCLRLGEPGKNRRYRKVDRESVRIINQNIAVNSERFIMGPSKAQLENVIERSGSGEMQSAPRLAIETIQSDDDGSLQKFSAMPRGYFYPKDGSLSAP